MGLAGIALIRCRAVVDFASEQGVMIANRVPFASQDSLLGIGEIAGDLAHPQAIRRRRDAGDLHFAGR